jgi:isopentenyl phosphate kinase
MPTRGRAGRDGGVYVVKLGGSSITFKDKPFTPNLHRLKKFARALSELRRDGLLAGVVVGGGSYGHFVANTIPPSEGAQAITSIHLAMTELVALVEEVLALYGVYTLAYPPHAICNPEGLHPNCSWNLALNALEHGVTPLTYGDVYPCSKGYCIVSGDELAMEMACALKADGVIYVSSVPGVLDGEGRVIPKLTLAEISAVAGGSVEGFDVTGGMRRKLEAIAANWCSNLRRVTIVGPEPSQLLEAARGGRAGTEIVPD